jgi:hypothetical protein
MQQVKALRTLLCISMNLYAQHCSSPFIYYIVFRLQLSEFSMQPVFSLAVCAVLLCTSAYGAPASIASSAISSAAESSATAGYASDNANRIAWGPESLNAPQPIRDSLGATILGPQNIALDQQNPDLLAPPTTDSGTV